MSHSDQREELRIDDSAAVFVELPASGQDDAPEAAVQLLCRMVQASANGLRLRLDRRLPVGGLLTLRARFNQVAEPLRLAAEVRWVSEEKNSYLVGLRLLESQQYDVARWKLLIADRL